MFLSFARKRDCIPSNCEPVLAVLMRPATLTRVATPRWPRSEPWRGFLSTASWLPYNFVRVLPEHRLLRFKGQLRHSTLISRSGDRCRCVLIKKQGRMRDPVPLIKTEPACVMAAKRPPRKRNARRPAEPGWTGPYPNNGSQTSACRRPTTGQHSNRCSRPGPYRR